MYCFFGAIQIAFDWVYVVATQPDVQRRLQKEIDDNIDSNGNVKLDKKFNMHYVNAVIAEVARIASQTPFSIPKEAINDIEINGYFVPKGTSVMTCPYGIHRDENLFDDPFKFNPERFINDEGKYSLIKGYFAFGLGLDCEVALQCNLLI